LPVKVPPVFGASAAIAFRGTSLVPATTIAAVRRARKILRLIGSILAVG